MRYLSICSGLGGAELAFEPLGWECAGVSEVDAAACAVLQARWPKVKNFGDFTKIGVKDVGAIDLLVGGTPCQDFSVAGLRAGMDGDRGQLTIEFARLAERLRPRWLVWENVPGVLSVDGGRAFGTFLSILGKFGYGFAYRILDAQYAGVPQRRRRVFVVGHLGDWRRAAAVLFEQHSLSGHPPPRKEKGQRVAGCLKGGSGERGWSDPSDGNGGASEDSAFSVTSGTGTASHNILAFTQNSRDEVRVLGEDGEVAGSLSAEPGTHQTTYLAFDPTQVTSKTNRSNPQVGDPCHTLASGEMQFVAYEPVGFIHPRQLRGSETSNQVGIKPDADISDALTREGPGAVSYCIQDQNTGKSIKAKVSDVATCLGTRDLSKYQGTFNADVIQSVMQVRRLTPVECSRLQGVPDDYLDITYRGKPLADGLKYKLLGNGFAVPCVFWIGKRIQMVEELINGIS